MITGSTASALYGEPRATQDIDINLCPDRDFERNEIARRRPVRLFDVDVFVISPEGSVVSKLRWAATSESERQLRDAASVLVGCAGELDMDYVRREAESAGVTDLLAKILPADGEGSR